MDYNHLKAIHIIFVTSWFAGLFYLPRLLVYHTEANQRTETERRVLQEQFQKMERILFNAIMMPAMWITLLSGTGLVYWLWWDNFAAHGWLHLKLAFVAALVVYHLCCRQLVAELRAGKFRFTSLQLRLYNELATVLLFAIVFLVTLKNTLDWIWGIAGLVAFAITIMAAVRIVKMIREKNKPTDEVKKQV